MCDFPARQLIEHAHKIVGDNRYYDAAKLAYANGLIKLVGDLAFFHENSTGCRCWDKVLVELGYRDTEPTSGLIAAIPTIYAGVNFRSRLEARYAVFFDIIGWKWRYEPLDLKGWIPDFEVVFPCARSRCHGGHILLAEVKPYMSIDQFSGTSEYALATEGGGRGLPCDAVALFGNNPGVTYWKMNHGDDSLCQIADWIRDWEEVWKEAGNQVQWHRPKPPQSERSANPSSTRRPA